MDRSSAALPQELCHHEWASFPLEKVACHWAGETSRTGHIKLCDLPLPLVSRARSYHRDKIQGVGATEQLRQTLTAKGTRAVETSAFLSPSRGRDPSDRWEPSGQVG